MDTTLVARVAIAKATRGYDHEYDYLVPERHYGRAEAGRRAIVPFGSKNTGRYALILSVHNLSAENGAPAGALKQLIEIPDDKPLLSDKDIELAARMRDKYNCTWFHAFSCMLPAGWGRKPAAPEKTAAKGVRPAADAGALREAISTFRVNRAQQITALERILANPQWVCNGVTVQELSAEAGVSKAVIGTLVKNGYLAYCDCAANPVETGSEAVYTALPAAPAPDNRFTLTAEQDAALFGLERKLEPRVFSETLLYGITGSGKTEVYMRLIERIIALGRQAIVLVPEISLTPQMTQRFTAFFGDRIAIFHSRLTLTERKNQWMRVRNGGAQIALGARSAVFAPFPNLGAIIIDEEHESSYKSDMTPRYHTADIARMRCEAHGALLVYGSATPSVDLYYRAARGSCGIYVLNERTNRLPLPRVFITDMREELKNGNRSMFSRRLTRLLTGVLEERKQAILFLNRRGYSSFLLCRACGYIVSCRDCSVSFTYHRDSDRLVCHYCGLTAPAPHMCPSCGGTDVRSFGAGTERVEREIQQMFPRRRVLRMDRDTATGKDAYSRILNTFRNGDADILIGTQMIAKGHDFPNVTLVGVLAADSILNFSDFRATERTFQLLTQVAGRSGRGDAAGNVVIQTFNPDHFSVAAAKDHDYKSFYKQEMIARRALQYPPFMNIGVFMFTGVNDARVAESATFLYDVLKVALPDGLSILTPTRPPLAKIRERYRWRFVVKHRDVAVMESVARGMSDIFYKQKSSSGVDMSFDINPYSML